MPIKTWQSDLKSALVWSLGFFLPLLNDSQLFNLCFNSSWATLCLKTSWTRRRPHHSCGSPTLSLWDSRNHRNRLSPREGQKRVPSCREINGRMKTGAGGFWSTFSTFLIVTQVEVWGKVSSGLKRLTINQTRDAVSLTRGGEVRNWEVAKLKPPSEWIIFKKNLLYINTTFLSGSFQLQRLIGLRTWSYSIWLLKWKWGSCPPFQWLLITIEFFRCQGNGEKWLSHTILGRWLKFILWLSEGFTEK